MGFNPNRKFKCDYDRFFKIEPGAANLLLLLCELADTGTVKTTEKEIYLFMAARFNDPEAYQL